jgi:type III pantothenate kinase
MNRKEKPVMDSNRVVAVDIGNTNTDIGVVDIRNRICLARETIKTAQVSALLGASIMKVLKNAKLAPSTPIVICSVVAGMRRKAAGLLAPECRKSLQWVEYRASLPVSVVYKQPKRMGADRLADMLYANTVYPKRDVIVIDAGTTITIDLLVRGSRFAGGAIVPGVAMQFSALHRSTSQLPTANLSTKGGSLPGTSTDACIRGGVLFATAGGVERVVLELARSSAAKPVVLATGGAWPILMPLANFHHMYVPDLTLIGTALFYGTK